MPQEGPDEWGCLEDEFSHPYQLTASPSLVVYPVFFSFVPLLVSPPLLLSGISIRLEPSTPPPP